MRAAACREVASAREQLHRFQVDLLISSLCRARGRAGFRKGGRIENDHIPVAAVFVLRLRQQLEHIRGHKIHIRDPVELRVALCHVDRRLRDIHSGDVLGGLRRVQRERPRMREAVQHTFAPCDLRDGAAVVFLVEEKACFLSLDIVHVIADTVLGDDDLAAQVGPQPFHRIKALVLFQPLQLAHLDVVALVDRVDRIAALSQRLDQIAEQHLLDTVDTQRQHLCHQHVLELIHRQPREAVCLAEDQTAGGKVLSHHRHAVVERVVDAAAVKRLIKFIVRVL